MNNIILNFLIGGSEITGFECGGADILRIIKFAEKLLDIVFIMIPILLIIMISVDFAKNVIAGKVEDMQKNVTLVLKRILMTVALFLVPTIVEFVMLLLGEQGLDFARCVDIAINQDLTKYEFNLPEEEYNGKEVNLSSPGNGLTVVEGSNQNASEVIETATKWMEDIARDKTHGYNNDGNIDHMYGDTGQYNCIGLVVMGWNYAGLTTINKKVGFTNLETKFPEAGFKEVTEEVNLKTGAGLERGDVLARTYKVNGHWHIAQYVGNGKLVEATGDADGKNGDSSGSEIAINKYYNNPWNHVYRYVGN